MPSAHRFSCAFVLIALSAAPGSFAASIEITNLRTFATPFGDRVTQVALNDHGDIAGTSFTTGIFDSQSGFIIPANGLPPLQIKNAAAQYTEVHGINNAGTLAGLYLGTDGLHGFTYSAGTYTPVSVGTETYLYGINNRGDLTGYYSNIGLTATGFLLQGGTTTTFAVPGHPFDTFPLSLNDADQVVGYYSSGNFLRQSDGSLQTLDFGVRGINNQGILVGSRGTGSGAPNDPVSGIVSIAGAEYTFSYPGAPQTYLYGINNANQVVGIYDDARGASHIFEGQLAIPEPSTACLCGLVGLGAAVLVVPRTRRKPSGPRC